MKPCLFWIYVDLFGAKNNNDYIPFVRSCFDDVRRRCPSFDDVRRRCPSGNTDGRRSVLPQVKG